MGKALTAALATALVATPVAAQSVEAGKWTVGNRQAFDRWSITRMETGCFLYAVGPSPDQGLGLSSDSLEPYDSFSFVDPALESVASDDMLTDAKLSIDGKAIRLMGSLIMGGPGSDGVWNYTVVNAFSPSISKGFSGKPVTVQFQGRGKILERIFDPSAEALAAWRACTKQMRSQ